MRRFGLAMGIFGKRIRRWRLGSARARRDKDLSYDNSKFVASARRHCLLTFVFGMVAMQWAWDESTHNAALRLYPYVEKVFKVASAVESEDWKAGEYSVGAAEWSRGLPGSLNLLGPLAGPEVEMEYLQLEGAPGKLATSSDPTSNCFLAVFRFNWVETSEGRLALWVLVDSRSMLHSQGDFADARAVSFPLGCAELGEPQDPFLVVRYESAEQAKRTGVVLADSVLLRLGIDTLDSSPREVTTAKLAEQIDGAVGHLSDDQMERLRGFDRRQLTTLDLNFLGGVVVSKAREITRQNFQPGDVEGAFQAILRAPGTADPYVMWGVRLGRDLVLIAFPVGLLALAFSLLYRLRRIDPRADVLDEPWVVILPEGFVERLGATVWAVMPVAAGVGVVWATWEHHIEVRSEAYFWLSTIDAGRSMILVVRFLSWLLQTPLFWSFVVELVAVVFLVQAAVRMRRLGAKEMSNGLVGRGAKPVAREDA